MSKDVAVTEKPKSTLVEIVAQAQVLEQKIAEAGGELTPEIEQALSNIDLSLAEKVEGYAHVMDRLEAVSTYWKSKADELSAISRGLKNASTSIKDRLKSAMIELRKDEVFGESLRFMLTPTKGSLVIEDETKIPDALKITVTSVVPDKDRIRAALEACESVPGAKLEGGYQLRKYANRKS